MAKIILVRHGQDTDNAAGILNGRRDTELTELGRSQAKAVAEKLRDDNIQIVLHSPLKRATQTAQIIAESLGGKEIHPNDALIERDFGFMTGQAVANIPKLTDNILVTEKINYFLDVDGSEPFDDVYERAKKFIEFVKATYPDKNVLGVTHGDIGKIIQAAYHGWSWKDGLKMPYLDNTGVLHLGTADTIE